MEHTKYLKTFVAPEDYNKFLTTLKQLHNGKIKKTTSIINIYGEFCTGKTSLINLLFNISCFSPTCINHIIENYISFKNDLILHEGNCDENKLKKYIETAKKGELMGRELYKKWEKIGNPGVLIITNSKPVNFSFNNRNTINLHLPYKKTTLGMYSKYFLCFKSEFSDILGKEERGFILLLCLKRNKIFLYKDLRRMLYEFCLR
jgi:hypothetical protein